MNEMEIICPAIEFLDRNHVLQTRRGAGYEEIVQPIRKEGLRECYDRWHTEGYMDRIAGITMFVNNSEFGESNHE
ncbi:MAG: hypothetical protein IJ719_21195 [Clostridia bacterium]|nr:hypothetical protein [Clostridia bacterium]